MEEKNSLELVIFITAFSKLSTVPLWSVSSTGKFPLKTLNAASGSQ